LRITPLLRVSHSLPQADCSALGSWRSVRVYGSLRTLTRRSLVLLANCSLRITPCGAFRAQHLKFSPARGLLRVRHLASGFRLRIAPRPSTFAPCDGLGSLRSRRFELGIDPEVQVLRAQCFSLRPACRLLHTRHLTLCILRRLLRASNLESHVSRESLRL